MHSPLWTLVSECLQLQYRISIDGLNRLKSVLFAFFFHSFAFVLNCFIQISASVFFFQHFSFYKCYIWCTENAYGKWRREEWKEIPQKIFKTDWFMRIDIVFETRFFSLDDLLRFFFESYWKMFACRLGSNKEFPSNLNESDVFDSWFLVYNQTEWC